MDPSVNRDVFEYDFNIELCSEYSDVLVTGATGMLGAYAVEFFCELSRLHQLDRKIVAMVRKSSPYLAALESHYPDCLRVCYYEDLDSVLLSGQNWLVVHAASPASPDQFENDPFGLVATNVMMTLQVAQALKVVGGHAVYLSSGEIYGPSPKIPTSETDSSGFDHLGPRGSYPESKRSGELILQAFSTEYGFGATCLRVYHTFGPGIDIDQSRIFSTVIKSLVNEAPIELRTTGLAQRSFLYSSDLLNAVLICGRTTGFRAANVAGDSEISIRQFAEIASQLSGGNSPVIVNASSGDREVPTESPILRGSANTGVLRALGWSPAVNIEDGITRTVESVKWRTQQGLLGR